MILCQLDLERAANKKSSMMSLSSYCSPMQDLLDL